MFKKDLHVGVRDAITLIACLLLLPTPSIKIIYCRIVISRSPVADTDSVVVSRSIQFDERTTERRQLINALEGGVQLVGPLPNEQTVRIATRCVIGESDVDATKPHGSVRNTRNSRVRPRARRKTDPNLAVNRAREILSKISQKSTAQHQTLTRTKLLIKPQPMIPGHVRIRDAVGRPLRANSSYRSDRIAAQ